jgi:hypothetical protein
MDYIDAHRRHVMGRALAEQRKARGVAPRFT